MKTWIVGVKREAEFGKVRWEPEAMDMDSFVRIALLRDDDKPGFDIDLMLWSSEDPAARADIVYKCSMVPTDRVWVEFSKSWDEAERRNAKEDFCDKL